MDASVKEEYAHVSRPNRHRELAKKRLLFWAGRLQMMPHEVDGMSDGELNLRFEEVKRKEAAFEQRKIDFERWAELNQLRYLMYEEQRKYNERFGPGGPSIWRILAMAQLDLEEKLQIDQLRGSCQRFPSPMSLMEERHSGGRQRFLEPVRSSLCGCISESYDDLELRTDPSSEGYKQGHEEPLDDSLLPYFNKYCNPHVKSEDSFKCSGGSSDLGFCPLCKKKHLRLPPPF
ncbi:uncharacterized protein LOC27207767 [Drosophila simulans]|uniref:Uncharacterized protein n=1 Tax=Drosophila simulans TaxID=7240 RepID=A0A0J9RZ50_DROSI|nr:uncharacterized protein LOC27207767 [Drosophila simulans]KMZ00927.1 uncharacterized protein Dsimw501_GD27918 [Drosophila simulans]